MMIAEQFANILVIGIGFAFFLYAAFPRHKMTTTSRIYLAVMAVGFMVAGASMWDQVSSR